MTLRESIEQLVSLGEKDPHVIAERIRTRNDNTWLAKELLDVADDVISDIARSVLNSGRRSSLSLAKVEKLQKREIMLAAAWLPGIGWVEFGKFTANNFDHLAATYRKGAAALNRYAEWCEASAALIREQDVAEFRQVKGALPVLPAAVAA